MKGPGYRLDLDPRRLWECPACGRRLKLSGEVTFFTCDCRGEKSPAMRLVECLRKTESPFDHVGFAAQKRIDAAKRKPEEADEAPPDEVPETPEPQIETVMEAALPPVDVTEISEPESEPRP